MKEISTSEQPGLKFTQEKNSHPFRALSNKIGWVTANANKVGAKYDIIIRDKAGRVRKEMLGCGSKEGSQHGEMINLETNVGEDLDVSVENIQGAEEVDVFIN